MCMRKLRNAFPVSSELGLLLQLLPLEAHLLLELAAHLVLQRQLLQLLVGIQVLLLRSLFPLLLVEIQMRLLLLGDHPLPHV